MVDPRLYETEHYVLLETNQPEQILSAGELRDRLHTIVTTRPEHLPPDIQHLDAAADKVQYLLDTMCELDLGPGEYFQWFAVRLDK
ncbi:MAG: chlororespiratory reduction protein 7 [Leptolyngbyaceae bacterium]|nr:chlororespiratory reduction protein 7 [Leptolyngbyaceae bacterium]